MSPAPQADRRIRRLRGPKRPIDPQHPLGVTLEEEPRPGGGKEAAVTVFLAGAECPFTCSFCDLWQATLDGPTPAGALPLQLAEALESLQAKGWHPSRVKLYNASNFFDPHAVPPSDHPALAELLQPYEAVTVECHASLVGPACREFAARLSGRLEVAIGLESAHPEVLPRLNKRMSLERFDRAAEFLLAGGIALRGFVLLGTPHIEPRETVDWTVRSAEYALARGARMVSLIPVRGGNGEMERLARQGEFVAPSLRQLEQAQQRCLDLGPGLVVADLWDAERLAGCPACRRDRLGRIRRMALEREAPEPVSCAECGGA